jgi:hypothetical protein
MAALQLATACGHVLNLKQIGRGSGRQGLGPRGAAPCQVENRSSGHGAESHPLEEAAARNSVLAHPEILLAAAGRLKSARRPPAAKCDRRRYGTHCGST